VTPDELREEIAVELEQMEIIVGEIALLRRDVAGRDPTIREKTASSALTQACPAPRPLLLVDNLHGS
jgi:hypothetical protein